MKATTANRKLCTDFFDAIERNDLDAVGACYAPDMTMWVNASLQTITREENLEAVDKGRALHRRRTYDDRQIRTFDDGFLVQYTCVVVAHDGTRVVLQPCLVGEVRDGLITKLFEYMDTSKFPRPRRKVEEAVS